MKSKIQNSVLFLIALSILSLNDLHGSHAEGLKAEEIVAKHLDSIGPAKVRGSIKSRIISGTSLVNLRAPRGGQAEGRAVLASEGVKSLIGMSFQTPGYPQEKLGYNGSTFMAAYLKPGMRSALGNFLMTHEAVFKQGLMGGTLSSAWPLLDVASRNPQLEYVGTKKIEGRVLHELKYLPRGGSDLKIVLFFDQETFQHVRTEYERVIAAPTGNRSYTNIEERETRYKMVEEFSDFKDESGLTLPHTYNIRLAVDAQKGTFLADWTIKLTQFTFNEKIDPAAFNISVN